MNNLSIYCADYHPLQDPDHQNLLCSHGITDVLCQCVHSTTPKVNHIFVNLIKRLFLIRSGYVYVHIHVGDPCCSTVPVFSGI